LHLLNFRKKELIRKENTLDECGARKALEAETQAKDIQGIELRAVVGVDSGDMTREGLGEGWKKESGVGEKDGDAAKHGS